MIPQSGSEYVLRDFLKQAEFDEEPLELKLTSVDFKTYERQCFFNCENARKELGWPAAFGWIIYAFGGPTPWVDAVFHAVSISEGSIIDITPRDDLSEVILFVPDKNRVAARLDTHTWQSWGNILLRNDGEFIPTRKKIISNWQPRDS